MIMMRNSLPRVYELSEKKGVSMAQISLAWIMGRPGKLSWAVETLK
jgi:aryl-alcohol dehydrogenase-like predicted oxidoreductase